MPEWINNEEELQRLMLDIKKRAGQRSLLSPRRSAATLNRVRKQDQTQCALPELKVSPDFRPNKNDHYQLADLLKYHDREFVRNAYLAILKREPDEAGRNGFLEPLRAGEINKIDILAGLIDSGEGRQSGVTIDGLKSKSFVRKFGRLPLVGYLLQLVIAILRLPVAIKDRRQFENYSLAQHIQIIDSINETRRGVNAALDRASDLEAVASGLNANLSEQSTLLSNHATELERLDTFAKILETGLAKQRDSTKELETGLDQLNTFTKELERNLALQQSRTASLVGAAKALESRPVASIAANPMLDTVYAALEDRFRGERNELKERFRAYLPYLQDANITAGVLDVGSGRGEWLELLKENGIAGTGVDSNLLMIARCKEAGLEVISENALDYLRNLDAGSLSAVSGFHIIEHLVFEDLLAFIDEALRALKPGGLLLLETPNAENIIVGSCNFYLDPQHIRPIPPEVAEFLLKERGFVDIEVIKLHPLTSQRVAGDSELVHRFNDLFYGPMDYGIVARRSS